MVEEASEFDHVQGPRSQAGSADDRGGGPAKKLRIFLAAWHGLALLTKPENIAIFWPTPGSVTGTLIALGRNAIDSETREDHAE
jgi:hypothetical protein